jgi:hypothetical protein
VPAAQESPAPARPVSSRTLLSEGEELRSSEGSALPEAPAQAAVVPPKAPSSPVKPLAAGDVAVNRNEVKIPFPLLIVLGIALLSIAGIAIVYAATRKLHRSPNKTMAYVAGRTVSRSSEGLAKSMTVKRPKEKGGQNYGTSALADPAGTSREADERGRSSTGSQSGLLLSLFVEDQNTNIGRRNTHALKAGNVYTLGGGNSDYLIFLVSLPPHIGEVHFDGKECSFVPKKPEYFPDLGDQTVPNCIGKTIRVVSDKKYELKFRMERYEDPIISLNRLLNSVSVVEKTL